METQASRQDGASLYTELARLDKYTILKLPRIPVSKEMMVEDWLESVDGQTTAPARVPSSGSSSTRAFEHGSDMVSRDSYPVRRGHYVDRGKNLSMAKMAHRIGILATIR